MPATTETVPGVEPRGFSFPADFDIHDPLTLVSHCCEIDVIESRPAWPRNSCRARRRKRITRISPLAYAALYDPKADHLGAVIAADASSAASLWPALKVGVRFDDGCEWDLLDCAIHGQRADLIQHWLPRPLSSQADERLRHRLDEALIAAVDAYSETQDLSRCIPVEDIETSHGASKAMTIVRLAQAGATGYTGYWSEEVVVQYPSPGSPGGPLHTVRRENLFKIPGVGQAGSVDGRMGLLEVAAWCLKGDDDRPRVLRSLIEQGLCFDHRKLLKASAQRCDDSLYFLLKEMGADQENFDHAGADFLSVISGVVNALHPGSRRRSDLEAFLAAVQCSAASDQIAAIRASAARLRRQSEALSSVA